MKTPDDTLGLRHRTLRLARRLRQALAQLVRVPTAQGLSLGELLDLHGVRRACQRLLGKPVAGPAAAMAGRGAVVCVRLGGLNTLGVAAGNLHWCAPGERGLVWRPMAEVKLAWEL
jgi:hypothetical protein